MSYDGSLKFDTKIDTEGFAEGLKKIQDIAKSIMSNVGKSTESATKAIQTITDSAKESSVQIKDTSEQLEKFKKKSSELSKTDEFEKSLSDINQSLKMLDSEMKLIDSQFNKNNDSAERLAARHSFLAEKIELQKQKIEVLEQALKKSADEFGKNDKQTQNWQIELNKAKTTLSGMENKLKDNSTAFDKLSEKTQNADKKTDDFGSEVKETEKEIDTLDDTSKDASESVEKLGNVSSKTKGKLEPLKVTSTQIGKGFTSIVKTAGKAVSTIAKYMATAVTTVSAGALAIGTAAVNAGIDFESAFAGVKKTVDATDEELSELRQGLIDMSKEIPQSASDLSAIAEAAGQLGIETENIEKFTEVMANLGVATNMTSDEAATSFARFANITGMSQTDFDKLGSTVVALGNNLATTESEIVDMSLRIAGAGKQVGMTESEIMSFSGALSSVGIEAEMGGSAFSTLISKMSLAVENGGDDLENFAKVSGVTADEFKTAFKSNATSAISSFIKGLDNINKNGGSAIATLSDMDITETRMRDTLLRASSASDTFTEALKIGSNAWEDNTALTKEAEQRYETLESKIQLFKNGLEGLGIAFKDSIDTELRESVDLGIGYIDELSNAFTNGGLQGAVAAAGDIFGELAAKAAENAPKMIDSALQFVDSFVDGIKNNSSKLLEVGHNILQSIVEGIINFAGYTSDLVEAITALIQGLITTISENSGELLRVGESIIDAIVNGIVNLAGNAQTVVKGVTALIQSLIKSVKDNKDKLITAAKQIVKAITDGLVSLLPKEVQTPVKKCINAITKLFNSNSLKTAIEKVGKFIGELAETISNLASNVIPICTDVLEFLIDNFDIIAPLIITAVTAIKAYREATVLANIAQSALNGTMSANPIGAVITLVGILVGGIMTLSTWLNRASEDDAELVKSQEELEQSQEDLDVANENLANSFSNIKSSMDDFRSGIDTAKSSMENFDDSLIIPDSVKQKLQEDMEDTQQKIDEIVYAASGERKKLTENEIEALETLIKKQLELANRNLNLTTRYQDSANEKTKVFSENFDGSLDEFEEQSQEYLKGADEAYEKVADAADEKLNQELANLMNLRGTEAKYNAEWYKAESEKAYKNYEDEIATAQKKKSESYQIISDSYNERTNLLDSYLKANNSYNDKLAKAEEYKNKKIVEIQEKYNKKLAEIKEKGVNVTKNINKLNDDVETERNNAKKEYNKQIENAEKELTNFFNDESTEQIGIMLEMVKQTAESGGEISDDTALMVYSLNQSLKNLPDDVKEKLGDVYDEMVNTFDGVPATVYEQGRNIAFSIVEGLNDGVVSQLPFVGNIFSSVANSSIDIIKKILKINSPSKVMQSLGRFTTEGLIIGLKDKAKSLADMAKSLAVSVSDTMSNGLSGTIIPDIMLDTNAEMSAKLKAAVFAQVSDIGVSVANRSADIYDTSANDTNSTIKASGNINAHISIDGREFAVATVPYIDEELAFSKG